MREKEKVVFTCIYCKKEFSFPSHLKKHVLIHTGQKDYRCPLCNHSTAEKQDLEVHIRRHLQEKPFKCQEPNCGASFATSGELKTHQISHNKNDKEVRFVFIQNPI